MAGLSDKIKKVTSALSKKGKKKEADSPFGSEAPPFLQSTPDLGSVPDLSAGFPPGGPPGIGAPPGPPGVDSPQFPPGMGAPGGPPGALPGPGVQQVQQSSVDNEMVEENRKKLKDVETKVSKADVTLSMVQKDNEDIRKTVDKIDQSVLELLSLYEIVSNQVNPFVGDDAGSRDTIERFEKTDKRITELGDMLVLIKNELDTTNQKLSMPTGISEEVNTRMQDLESKMDAFADAMVMMHEGIEKLTARSEEISTRTDVLDQNIVDLAEATANISLRIDELEKNGPVSKRAKSAEESTESAFSDEEAAEEGETDVAGASKKMALPMVRLESIKADPTSVVVLLNWIEFLMERVGRNNLMDALDYYVDIGWISEDVMSEIMAYARGIDYYVEKPTWRLLPEDHTKSLLFIERLSGRKIDRNMLSSIDREMAKVKHGLEELYGI
ncbi:FlaD/FlaE family flagellar protein [Methanolobus sp. WCC4]|uniref:FlaD/FlaE family flagellar protein n=1 Tax=Methanolobus sp. WCC4 TaxID=3125784 RepID=UPI0030F9033D